MNLTAYILSVICTISLWGFYRTFFSTTTPICFPFLAVLISSILYLVFKNQFDGKE